MTVSPGSAGGFLHFRAVRVHFAASVPPARKRLLYCHYVRPRRRGYSANILDAGNYGLAYMGVGFINSSPRYWVQLFTTSQGFTSVTSSSGSLTFPSVEAMQKEYLICTDKEGVVSYLPIDVSAMTQNGDSFTLELVGRTVTLTISGKKDPTIDMNGDGQASVSDMQCLFDYLSTGKAPANASFMKLADVNGDNEINILDYQAMYQRLKS